jgi:hypothetical protein
MNAAATPPLSIDAFETATISVDAFDHEAHIYYSRDLLMSDRARQSFILPDRLLA